MNPKRSLLSLPLVATLAAGALAASSGVQITPDGKRSLVSKDVGSDRWAITCEDDGTITGNVYRTDGDVAFVWCEPTGDDGGPSPIGRTYYLDCYGADACGETPCGPEQWRFIAPIELPGSFCLPPAPTATPAPSPQASAPLVTPRPTPAEEPTADATPRPTPMRTPTPTPDVIFSPNTPIPTFVPTPRPTAPPALTPKPTTAPTARPTARPTPRATPRPPCCRVCMTGKACGDTCISRDKTCHVGPGCACNG